jgi:hypothetical protein
MLRCKDVLKLSRGDVEITAMQRLELRMHVWFCPFCKKYAQQVEILKHAVRNVFLKNAESVSEIKIRDLEEKIIKKIKK